MSQPKPKTKIRKSSIHGRGVFSNIALKKGTLLKLVNETRIFEFQQGCDPRSVVGRRINHQSRPNTVWFKKGDIWFAKLKKDVPKDTELTISYTHNSPWFVDKSLDF